MGPRNPRHSVTLHVSKSGISFGTSTPIPPHAMRVGKGGLNAEVSVLDASVPLRVAVPAYKYSSMTGNPWQHAKAQTHYQSIVLSKWETFPALASHKTSPNMGEVSSSYRF